MRLIVLGGTHFVGRAICDAAYRRGYDVVVFNRGKSGPPPRGSLAVRGDRTMVADLRALARLVDDRGGADIVIDPACYAPSHAMLSARILKEVAPSYAVVSTVTAHRDWPQYPVEASSRTYETAITEGPSADVARYGQLKAGIERAVETIYGHINTLIVRPGIVLGPHEDQGRLADYLRRADKAPFVVGGSPDRAFQYVDARDLAEFVLLCAETGRPGSYDVVTQPGAYTWGDVAEAIGAATGGKPVFVPDQLLLEAGVEPWRGLPLWLPESADTANAFTVNGQAAFDYGFVPRPLLSTVSDTWEWLQEEGPDWVPTARSAVAGLDLDVQTRLLAEVDG